MSLDETLRSDCRSYIFTILLGDTATHEASALFPTHTFAICFCFLFLETNVYLSRKVMVGHYL